MGKKTPIYQLPYPEPGDDTRTWIYWQQLAEATEAALSGWSFATVAERDAAFPTPKAGMRGYVADHAGECLHNGTSWIWLPLGLIATGYDNTTREIPGGTTQLAVSTTFEVPSTKRTYRVVASQRCQSNDNVSGRYQVHLVPGTSPAMTNEIVIATKMNVGAQETFNLENTAQAKSVGKNTAAGYITTYAQTMHIGDWAYALLHVYDVGAID